MRKLLIVNGCFAAVILLSVVGFQKFAQPTTPSWMHPTDQQVQDNRLYLVCYDVIVHRATGTHDINTVPVADRATINSICQEITAGMR